MKRKPTKKCSTAVLTLAVAGASAPAAEMPAARLSPEVRGAPLAAPVVAPLTLRAPALAGIPPTAAVVVAIDGGRSMAGAGEVVLARHHADSGRLDAFRATAKVRDPDSGRMLGPALLRIGTVQPAGLPRDGGEQGFTVVHATTALQPGDLLVPSPNSTPSLRPASEARAVPAKVAAVLGGRRWATTGDIVMLNRGSGDGLEAGSVLRTDGQVRIATSYAGGARLLVFDVADGHALALVIQSRAELAAGDMAIPLAQDSH